jgi:hypothetical protein
MDDGWKRITGNFSLAANPHACALPGLAYLIVEGAEIKAGSKLHVESSPNFIKSEGVLRAWDSENMVVQFAFWPSENLEAVYTLSVNAPAEPGGFPFVSAQIDLTVRQVRNLRDLRWLVWTPQRKASFMIGFLLDDLGDGEKKVLAS